MTPTFHHRVLPNGLTIVAEAAPAAHTSAVGFFVKTGTRDEERRLMGVSHFLEHMMFKGTARRSGDDVNREFDEIGADYNAYTSQETTVYYARVLPEHLPRAVDLLGDMLRPALREADFDMEKNVILEEIGMYEDRPQWRLQDRTVEAFFGEHPLGFRVLGTSQSIRALTCDEMRGYFEARYGPENVTVAAAGRVDFERLVDDVDKAAGHWKLTGAARNYGEPVCCPRIEAIPDAKVNRHYTALMCPGPSAQDPARYAAKVLADVLGDSDGSRLYWALIDPGLADEADFSYFPQDRCGAYFGFTSCDPERAERVEAVMLETIDGLAHSLDAGEIERAKNKLATQATVQDENPGGRMRAIGGEWIYLGEYLTLQEEIDRLMGVTVEDVRALLERFTLQPRTIVRLGPK